MMEHDNEPLTPAEQRAFDALPREIAPPPHLEDLVTSSLQRTPAHPRRRPVRAWLAAAAAAIVFASGFLASQLLNRASSAPNRSPRYLFLLYDTPGTATADPAAGQRLFEEYSAWFAREHASGAVESGEKLDEAERTLGPAVSANPRPAGLFVVNAGSLDEALAIGRRCPHVAYGGTIVVRPIL